VPSITRFLQEGISKELTAASFVRPSRPTDGRRTFVEALRYKYASEHTDIVFQNGRPADKAIQISGKEVEEVGFEKIRKQLAELHELKIVLLDGLCVHQPLDLGAEGARLERNVLQNALPEIRKVCPKIVELDLSRNLFEHWDSIVSICEQLQNLRSLRLDGNRIRTVNFNRSQKLFFQHVFEKITTLSLEDNLLTWEKAVEVMSLFPTLKTMTLSKNYFCALTTEPSLNDSQSITTLILESNEFTSLSDLAPLIRLRSLTRLLLKKNKIATLATPSSNKPAPIFPATLTELDLSHNAISSWPLINSLSTNFPGLTSLRIAHNPLFTSLQAPNGRILTPDDGYLLTIARLPNLKSLNYSSISPKDALNAASYYLSLIAMELSFAPEADAETIKKSHPQWEKLCEEYGEPNIKRSNSNVNPRSLAAQLLRLKIQLSPGTVERLGQGETREVGHVFEIPKSLSVYAVLGLVGKHFGLPPMRMRIIWEMNELDLTNAAKVDGEDGLWDSEEEEEQVDLKGMGKRREVEVIAGTRDIGMWIEGSEANARIEAL
jgi:hypothetical protein